MDGRPGESAYAHAQSLGFRGNVEEWLRSLHGKDGAVGERGPAGRDGTDGRDGRDGVDGKDGQPGPMGSRGVQGKAGSDGRDGFNGWSPLIAVVADGERRIHQVVGWAGGTGEPPESGFYLGPDGPTRNIAEATDLRGASSARATGSGAGPLRLTFAALSDTPTTLAGYGITDAYTKAETDALVGGGAFDPAGSAAAAQAAAEAYADSLVTGLWDDRGNFDASGNAFPSSGGSGAAGAIVKGDIWTVSVAGTLGGHAVNVGDTVRALVDTPGSTDANWALGENNIGYVPLNAASNLSDLANAATALTNLGGTTVGQAFFTLANPSAITFARINADNTVTARSAANFRTDLGLGTADSPTLAGLTLSALTAGSILFAGASGAVSQDNASLFFADTAGATKKLGIGGTPTDPFAAAFAQGLFITNSGADGDAAAEVVLKNDAGEYLGLWHYSSAGGYSALETDAAAGLRLVADVGTAVVYGNTGVDIKTGGLSDPIQLLPNHAVPGSIMSDAHVIRSGRYNNNTLYVSPDRVWISGIKTSLDPGASNDTIGLHLTATNDSPTSTPLWGTYVQVTAASGSASASQSMAMEASLVNNNAAVTSDPFNANPSTSTHGVRVTSGNATGEGTTHNTVAFEVLPNPQKFATGFLIGNGALRTDAGLTHPSALALPAGANGYALTWYWQTGFTTPVWQVYSSATAGSGYSLNLGNNVATFSTPVAVNSSAAPDGALKVTPASAASVAVGVKMFASQTASMFRIYDESNNIMFSSPPRTSSDHRVKFNWYNTSETTLTNYERLVIYADGTLLNLDSEIAGTGTRRAIAINKSGGRTLIGGSTDDAATLLQVNGTAKITGDVNLSSTLTGTGDAKFGADAGTARNVIVNGAAGNIRGFQWATAGSTRWETICGSGAEVGSDAGSSWFLRAYTDAGSLIDAPITIGRPAGGAITLARPTTVSSGTFTISGNISAAAWTTAGIALKTVAATYTDTSSSGTVATVGVSALGIPTLAASSSTTYTNSATLYIAGAPVAGTNVTLGGKYGLLIGGGGMNVQGGGFWAAGAININVTGTSAVNIQSTSGASTCNLGNSSSTLNVAAGSIGFFGVTATTRAIGYTQTYSTATKTHSNLTSATLTDNTAGSADATLQALSSGTVYATDVAAIRNNFADLAAQVNALRVDLVNAKGVINSIIDDGQAYGLLQ